MAVDKHRISESSNFVQILSSRVSLEDTLARFDEQCSRYEPNVIRTRLKKRLSDVRVNINGREED
jgi:hypothetical protein